MEDPDRPGDHACPHTLVTSIPDGIHKHKHTHNVNRWIEAYPTTANTIQRAAARPARTQSLTLRPHVRSCRAPSVPFGE